MTTFATEEAKVVIHSSLLLWLGQLAILSEFRGEVRLVAVGRAGGGLSELFKEDTELLLLELELPLFKLELFFLLSNWLLAFVDLSDLLALLEQVVFSWLILE